MHSSLAVTIAAPFFLAASYGDNSSPADTAPSLEKVPLHIAIDIRDNLRSHYGHSSTRLPAESRTFQGPFDFQETTRSLTADGQATIRGEFLFGSGSDTVNSGTIAVTFARRHGAWVRTGRFHVDETPIRSRSLVATVRDASTQKPLANVRILATRARDPGRRLGVVATDHSGRARIETLDGVYRVAASARGYHPGVAKVAASRHAGRVELHLLPCARPAGSPSAATSF